MENAYKIKKTSRFASVFQKIGPYLFLTIGGIVMVYPFVYSLLGSLCSVEEYKASLLLPIPKHPWTELGNYAILFKAETDILFPMFLTVSRMVVGFVVSVFVSSFGGYVFAKVNFKYKRIVFTILLSSTMIPGVAMMVPNFIWMSKFPLVGGNNILGDGGTGWVDNPGVLYITGWVSAYSIFLFRQCFVSLGNDMAESGEIDGASFVRIVLQLYLPLVRPIFSMMILNTFVANWNDYMTSLIMLPSKTEYRLLATTSATLMELFSNPQRFGGADYPKTFAIATVMMIPPLIVYLLVQKQFVEGLAMGAVKG